MKFSSTVVAMLLSMDSAICLNLRRGSTCTGRLHRKEEMMCSIKPRQLLPFGGFGPLHGREGLLSYPVGRAFFGTLGCRSSRSSRLHLYENDQRQYTTDSATLRLFIPTTDDMEEMGALVASLTLLNGAANNDASQSAAGGVIFLQGDLGAGKTAFARGFLRAATGDWQLRVTSPTFLLSNTYLATAAKGANQDLE